MPAEQGPTFPRFLLLLSRCALCPRARDDKTFFSSQARAPNFLQVNRPPIMALSPQTAVLLKAARQLLDELAADAVLLLIETDLDWDEVLDLLPADKLLISAKDLELHAQLHKH